MTESEMPPDDWAIEMIDVTRAFARVVANDHVTLRVRRGEVHALVGENGAGKSTLMKILYGLYQPDSGEIRVHGQPVRFRSPADAIAAGIGMVHQHFMLIPVFTVAENVILGDERFRFGLYSPREADTRVRDLSARYAIALDPTAIVGDLGVGEQQRVEILKILYRNASIIILDEPTAVLTPQEVEALFQTVRQLREAGKTLVIITHKLHEVMAISQRLTVLRDGRVVGTMDTASTTPEEIARLMVGREVVLPTLARDIAKARGSSHAEPHAVDQSAAGAQAAPAPSAETPPAAGRPAPLRLQGIGLQRGRGRPAAGYGHTLCPGQDAAAAAGGPAPAPATIRRGGGRGFRCDQQKPLPPGLAAEG